VAASFDNLDHALMMRAVGKYTQGRWILLYVQRWLEASTGYIGGSTVDYTVDEASDRLVDGSRTTPRSVAEFWTFTRTFTRPEGLTASHETLVQ
jgi:hypothetical protein